MSAISFLFPPYLFLGKFILQIIKVDQIYLVRMQNFSYKILKGEVRKLHERICVGSFFTVGGGPNNLWITSTCIIHHCGRTATFQAKVQLFFLLLNSFIVARKLKKMNSSQYACACNLKRFAHQMKLNERQLFGKELSETDWVLLEENRGWA